MNENFDDFQKREDPLAARLFIYAFGAALAALAAAGIMFLLQTGVLFRPIANYNLRNIESSNKRILWWTKLAGFAGAGAAVYYSARN